MEVKGLSKEDGKSRGRLTATAAEPTWRRTARSWALPLVLAGLLIIGAVVGGALIRSRAASVPPLGTSNVGRAPDFKITAYQGEDVLEGKEVRFSQLLSKGKPVVLNFWAGLCPPCLVEMPDLQRMHEQYQDRVLLFGLDVGPFVGLGSREDGRALVKELKVTFPAGTTFDADVVRSYKVLGMPTTYFIKPDGKIHRQWTGLLTKEKLTELVEELIGVSKGS